MDDQERQQGMPSVLESGLQEVPDMHPGSPVKLTKIDPKTGKHLEQKAPLQGSLLYHGICVEHSVFVWFREDYLPDTTSKVSKIDKMSDGSYWIHTASGSVYRLVMDDNFTTMHGTPVDKNIHKQRGGFLGFLRRLFGRKS